MLQDVRHGLRLLVRQRGFTLIATLVLALGIGANTAVFGIINVLLLRPLVGHTDGAVVGLFSRDRVQPDSFRAFSYPNYADLRARTDLFASLTAHNFALAGLTEGNVTRRVLVDLVTANYFDTFGAPLARGRAFTPDEERPGADLPVAILSFQTWQRMGGGDVLGTTIVLNARRFTIVGVAAKAFGGSMALVTPEIWAPTGVYERVVNDFARDGLTGTLADRRFHNLIVIARLRPGVTIDALTPALAVAGGQMEQAYPAENKNQTLMLAPLARLAVSTRPQRDDELVALTVALLSMSAIVLVIASFNLANMLLARGGARQKEFAIRLAIGGSRARLMRQLLTEGFLLSILGGAVGLALASWSTHLLVAMLTPLSPVALSFDSTPDVRVFAATLGFCMVSTLVFGLLPAWKLSRTDAVPALKDQPGEIVRGRRSRWSAQHLLLMGQLACSLVMLASAGLFLRSALQAARSDPGFSFDRGVIVRVDGSLAGYDANRNRLLYAQLLERLRARTDVRAAGLATIMPFGDMSTSAMVQKAGAAIKSGDPRAKGELIDAQFTSIGTDYFKALGLGLRRGRDFTANEETAPGGARVAIVDEPLSRQLFGDADPIGRDIQYASHEEGQPPIVMQVVGVAPGLRHDLFDVAPVPHLYVPFGHEVRSEVFLHVETAATSATDEAALLPGLRALLLAVDPDLPILSIETRPMYRDRNLMIGMVRIGASIFIAFGVVALILASVGVYGVKAYLVSRRTREIGIRMALGATSGRVVWMILREGIGSSAAGLATGLALTVAAGTGLRNLSYQGRGVDAVILGGAATILVAAVLLASWLPARRAIGIEPVKAMRG